MNGSLGESRIQALESALRELVYQGREFVVGGNINITALEKIAGDEGATHRSVYNDRRIKFARAVDAAEKVARGRN